MTTRKKILDAALKEINLGSYFDTDTNKIARAAGFAPATFYKHYKDKSEVFLALYQDWHERQRAQIRKLVEKVPQLSELPEELAKIVLPNYVKNPGLRLSARILAHQDQKIQSFRDEQCEEIINLIAFIFKLYRLNVPARPELFGFILGLERLCDAVALGEFRRMKLSEKEARLVVVHHIQSLIEGGLS